MPRRQVLFESVFQQENHAFGPAPELPGMLFIDRFDIRYQTRRNTDIQLFVTRFFFHGSEPTPR